MIKINKFVILPVLLFIIIISVIVIYYTSKSHQNFIEGRVVLGSIEQTISTVGTVKPQNRLEIKPSINGRVEKILVDEGQKVKIGDILAFMSSTERATLVDAARLKGDEELKYWQKAYKETPIIAPIDGIIIVRNVEPGQTVTSNDSILVISDRLIVEADVDETDIGDVAVGQNAVISLDAYPDIKIDAIVDQISYESQIVNNVTIYKVDILPKTVPDVFRSGMSANVEIIVRKINDILLIPKSALIYENNNTLVLLKDLSNDKMKKVIIKTGLQRAEDIEVISGLKKDDVILVPQNQNIESKKDTGTNPFMPSFRGKKDK